MSIQSNKLLDPCSLAVLPDPKETFVNTYKLREITLIAQKAVGEDINYDITGNIMFESVDTIVTNQLTNIQSEQYNKNLLLDIYRNL